MSDLLKGIMSQVTPSMLQGIAGKLGESESGISKTLGAMVPTLLAGMIGKSSNSSAMSGLFSMLTDSKSSSLMDGIGSMISNGSFTQDSGSSDMVSKFVGSLLGDKSSSIMSTLSSFGGLKSGSTSSLLRIAGPLVMGFLSKKIASGGLNLSSFTNLLLSEKSSIMSALPSGMGNMLGLSAGSTNTSSVAPKSKSNMPLIIGVLLAGLLGLFAWKSCNKPTMPDVPKVTVPTINTDSIEAAAKAKLDAAATTVSGWFHKLSSGFELKGDSAGIERSLIDFIGSDNVVDKTTWFNFDRLVFQTGSAALDTAKSNDQLMNIAEILKAYPAVKLKVGGYTDNTGNAADNMKLSQERANTVKAALVAMGIDANRLDAEGYGDQHPVASNDTEEGRAQNRRIAVRVTAK